MKGFTLIEFMIVVIIFLIMLAAVFNALATGRSSWQSGNAQVQAQEEARRAMDWMVRELLGAKLVSISEDKSTIKFKVTIDEDIIDTTADDDVLDVNDSVEWGANDGTNDRLNWTIGYSLSSGQILRKIFNSDDTEQTSLKKVLANNVTAISFDPPSSVIDIDITAQKDTIRERTMESSLHSQVRLRN